MDMSAKLFLWYGLYYGKEKRDCNHYDTHLVQLPTHETYIESNIISSLDTFDHDLIEELNSQLVYKTVH